MLTQADILHWREYAHQLMLNANLILTCTENDAIEVADFGSGIFEKLGLIIHVYINTDRICAKELVLLPRQSCPQHSHPTVDGIPGKEETFRCRWGKVYIYVSGEPTSPIQALLPEGFADGYSIFHEVILHPGDQYTLNPDTSHWFQAGDEGAVLSEFSTTNSDDTDILDDPRLGRYF